MTIRNCIFFLAALVGACGGAGSKGDSSGPQDKASIEEGEALLEKGEWAEAASLFEQIVREKPDSAKGHYYLGLAKKNLGELEAAEQHYRLALGYDAKLSAAHNNLGLLLLENGDLAHAESELNTYLSQNPQEADAHFNYGLVLEASGELEKAKESYKKAAELDPEDPAPWFGLGDLSRRQGDLKEALGHYRKGREIAPDNAELALKEGQTLLDLKQLDKAVVVFDSLLSFSPCDPGVLTTAGILLAKFDEDDKAIALYKAAIDRDGNFASAHLLLGNALARKKQFKEAAGHFERFLEISPGAAEADDVKKRLQACRSQMK